MLNRIHLCVVKTLGALLLATSFMGYAGQAEEQVLTIYTSIDREWMTAAAEAYTKATGTKVEWIRASTNEIYARLQAESANPKGDVWFGGTFDSHYDAAEKGLTAPYCSPKMKELFPMTRDPMGQCRALGLYTGVIGFAVNHELLKKKGIAEPKSWKDLTKPEYKGLIIMPNPNTSGTAYTIISTILQLFGEKEGWEYLQKLHQNVAQYTASGTATNQLTGRGEGAIGISFLNGTVQFAEEGFPLKAVIPTDKTGYEIGGISLISKGPNLEAGKKFIDWALTGEAQTIAAKAKSFQFPSNTKAPSPELMAKHEIDFKKIKTIQYDFKWSAKNRVAFIDRWNRDIFSAKR